MHDLLNAVILGIIEGLTEFLPVSSTGHMILAMPLLGISADQPPWNILLWVSQLGAIAAVIVYFAGDLWRRIRHAPDPRGRTLKNHLLTKLFIAMVPTVVLGLTLKKYLDPLETMPVAVALALILGAAAMWWIDRRFRPVGLGAEPTPRRGGFATEIEDVSLTQAAWIGAIQCISMWPGVSRSGASIMGGMALGLAPRVATEFSFYLAIPTMLGAGIRTLWKHRNELTPDIAGVVLVGTGTSFLVALVVIAGFMRFVRTQRFTPFVVYRVLLGLAVLAWAYGG